VTYPFSVGLLGGRVLVSLVVEEALNHKLIYFISIGARPMELTIAAVLNGTPKLEPASNPPCLPQPFSSAFSGRVTTKSPRTLAYSANEPISWYFPPWTKAVTLSPSFKWGYLGEVVAIVPAKSHPTREPGTATTWYLMCFQSVGFWLSAWEW
jgi:hypothetical protein